MITETDKIRRVQDLRDLLKDDDLPEDEIRMYTIQLETLLPKPTKTLYIDADGLVFYTALSPQNLNTVKPIEGGTFKGIPIDEDNSIDIQESFLSLVNTVVETCRLESLKGNMIRFKDYKLVFTPSTNFRYDLFADYKIKRKDKVQTDELIELKKWVRTFGMMVEGVEADDVVAHYGRRGNPIASGDKDVIFGVPGNNYFYHSAHKKVYKTTKEEANLFVLLQSLAGDSGDDIPGLKGIGLKIEKGVIKAPRAMKVLSDKPCFDDVIKAYENHIICTHCLTQPRALAITYDKVKDLQKEVNNYLYGTCIKCREIRMFKAYTKDDAILTRRLVGLDQWKGPRRGLKIWNY